MSDSYVEAQKSERFIAGCLLIGVVLVTLVCLTQAKECYVADKQHETAVQTERAKRICPERP